MIITFPWISRGSMRRSSRWPQRRFPVHTRSQNRSPVSPSVSALAPPALDLTSSIHCSSGSERRREKISSAG